MYVVPTRVCLAGDALDWLDGYTVCAAIDLPTSIEEVSPDKWVSYRHRSLTEDLERFTQRRYPHLSIGSSLLAARCTAPSPGGLGTSSSICVGLIAEILRRHGQDPTQAVELAYEFELAITNGGGVDHLSIAHGGWIFTSSYGRGLPLVEETRSAAEGPAWAVTLLYTGIEKNCGESIARLRRKKRDEPDSMRRYIDDYSRISHDTWQAVATADLPAAQSCLEQAHVLMRDAMALSTLTIEKLRIRASQATGQTFKLTGSGRGGCLFTLHEPADTKTIRRSLLAAGVDGGDIFQCQIADGMTTIPAVTPPSFETAGRHQ